MDFKLIQLFSHPRGKRLNWPSILKVLGCRRSNFFKITFDIKTILENMFFSWKPETVAVVVKHFRQCVAGGEHQCAVSVSRASHLTNWDNLIAAVTILFDG